MAQYLSFFNLQCIPFRNAPDARFYVVLDHTNQVKSAILSSLSGGHGLAVLIGDVGSGKTTLTHHLIESLPKDTHVFWLAYPPETPDELYHFILRDLGVTAPPTGRTLLLDEIRSILMRGALLLPYLLVVDEAHYSNDAVLDALKFLNNLEGHGGKLLQILLVAQQDLTPILRKPRHASLVQRISCLRRMSRLTPSQSLHYVKNRLEKAGGSFRIFTPSALKLLLKKAEGLPRRINSLCHEAMLGAFFRKSPVIEVDDVVRAFLSLRIEATTPREAHDKPHPDTARRARPNSSRPFSMQAFFKLFKYPGVLVGIVLAIALLMIFAGKGHLPFRQPYPVVSVINDSLEGSSFQANISRFHFEQDLFHSDQERMDDSPEVIRSSRIIASDPEQNTGEVQANSVNMRAADQKVDSIWGDAGPIHNTLFKPYTVQIGTFGTEEQSMDAFGFWQGKGYPVYQHVVQRDAESRRYVVRLGGYDTMREATEAAALFNRLEREKAIPVAVADRSPDNRTVMIALPGSPKEARRTDTSASHDGDSELPVLEMQTSEVSPPEAFRVGGPPQLYSLLASGEVQSHVMTTGSKGQGGESLRASERGFIEVAVLEERSVAEALADQFEEAGWRVSVFTMGLDGKVRHRVLVGPFESPDEAVRIQADALNALGSIN